MMKCRNQTHADDIHSTLFHRFTYKYGEADEQSRRGYNQGNEFYYTLWNGKARIDVKQCWNNAETDKEYYVYAEERINGRWQPVKLRH